MIPELRHAFRFVFRESGLALAIVATLALGIGITAAAFSVLDAVVLRPLSYPDPDRLVVLWQQDRADKSPFTVSAANYRDWQRQASAFEAMAAIQQFSATDFSLASGGAPESVKGVHFSPALFQVLGVAPALGRVFTADDARQGADPVVVLGHDLWSARFGSNPDVVGRRIRLNGTDTTIVGIMPPAFAIPIVTAQLYVPLSWTDAQRRERRIANYLVIGRLKPGTTLAEARAQLDTIARGLERQYPDSNHDVGATLTPLFDEVVGDVRPSLLLIFAAAGCLLLMVCFNVANLLGTRGISRARELSVRAALGASARRLVGQTLVEGSVFAFLGGAAGTICGAWTLKAFVALFNDTRYFSLPRRQEVAFDWHVLLFVGLTCVLVTVVFSAWPATRAMRTDVAGTLRGVAGRGESRWRSLFVALEVALSMAIVIAAVMLGRSYRALSVESLGFSDAGLLTARLTMPVDRYATPAARAALVDRVVDRARAVPGAASVAAVQWLPLNGVQSIGSVSVPGRIDEVPPAFDFAVSPGYFETMQIPIVAGRAFDRRDGADARRVAILGESAVRTYFPREDPIGRVIRTDDREHTEWEVIGVAGDVRNMRPDRPPRPEMYVPIDQRPASAVTIVMRAANHDATRLAGPLRGIVSSIDADQALSDVKTMEQVVADASARWRVVAVLVGVFGAAAFVLALVGVAGVTSFNVIARTREFAIRVALGDTRTGIVRLVLRSLAPATLSGISIGLLASSLSRRLLSSFLYGAGATAGGVGAAAATAFGVVTIGIGCACAWRAAAAEPARVLYRE